MSARLYTSSATERLLLRIQTELRACGLDGTDKWRLLRLLFAISLRARAGRIPSPRPLASTDGGERGPEYRLQQITGEGKETDFTDLFTLLLAVQHDEDLFQPTRRGDLVALLQLHIEQGARTLESAWSADRDLFGVLADLLGPPSTATTEVPVSVPEAAIRRALLEIDIRVDIPDPPEVGPRLTRYTLHLPQLQAFDKLEPSLDKLAFVLGLPTGSLRVRQGAMPRTLWLDVPRSRESWRPVGLKEFELALEVRPADLVLPMCPGVGVLGTPVWLDLTRAPHALLGGSTGSGKSVALHGLLCSLIASTAAGTVRYTLIDLKRTELSAYRPIARTLPCEVITESQAALTALREAVEDMETRYGLLESRGQRDLAGLRGLGQDLSYRLIVIDELTDLVLQLPETEAHLVRIAQKGRAAGVHLLLATQRPDAQSFSGNLRSNVPGRVALAVQRTSESMIILGEAGAEGLMRPGDLLVSWGGAPLERAHSFDLKPAEVEIILHDRARGVA